jgi:hypothetical protein
MYRVDNFSRWYIDEDFGGFEDLEVLLSSIDFDQL